MKRWRHLSPATCRVAFVLSLAALSLPVASCDKQPRTSDIKIELWTLALRPTFTHYVESVLVEFEAAHPGVEVSWVDVPYDALSRKLIAAAAAGRAPDVVNFSDLQFARFASLGATRDLTGLLALVPDKVYLQGALAPARIDGRLGALPWYLTTPVCLINTHSLNDAGWTPAMLATDWSTLCQQARRYHDQTGGFLFSQPLAVESELPGMLLAEGLPPFVEDHGRLRADLTRDEVVGFIRQWVDLYRDGVLPREAATAGHAHLIELYQNGRIAVAVTGPQLPLAHRRHRAGRLPCHHRPARRHRPAPPLAHRGDVPERHFHKSTSQRSGGTGMLVDQPGKPTGVLQAREHPAQHPGHPE